MVLSVSFIDFFVLFEPFVVVLSRIEQGLAIAVTAVDEVLEE
jgi:hypothetical protein